MVVKTRWGNAPEKSQLSESSYAVSTQLIPQAIFNMLSLQLDGNDTLYVISLKKPYCGQGPSEVNEWLNKNLNF